MSEPRWLTRSDAERLHDYCIEHTGGAAGLRDENLLESALARPMNQFAYGQTDLFYLAALYADAIVRNHAFVDGNKRTAFSSAVLFLIKNGHKLKPEVGDAYADMMVELARGDIDVDFVADFLRQNTR